MSIRLTLTFRDIRQGREGRVRLVALRNNADIQQQSMAMKVSNRGYDMILILMYIADV